MSSPGFQDWLREVSRHFVGLSPEERVGTLLHLMTQCDTQEKFQWQQQLSQHLYRDILVWIPPEIAHKILSYLDARSLLHATLVSKAWHATVSRDKVLWDRMEEQLGIKFKHSKRYNQGALLSKGIQYRNELKNGKAFKLHHFPTRRPNLSPAIVNLAEFTGSKQQYIATGGLDFASQGNCETVIFSPIPAPSGFGRNSPPELSVITCPQNGPKLSVIKILSPEVVILGAVNGLVMKWSIAEQDLRKAPQRHAASIFSVDGNLDVFATGCGDHTCILWDCQTLTPLVTLRNQRHWVITVILAQEDDGRTSTLLTMSKEVIHVYSYQSRKEAAEMVEPKMRISVKSESDYSELRDVFFTPGIAYKNGRVTFIKQMALFETQTIGDADIVSVDVRSGKVLSTIHINQKIRKLLGAGQRFALLLLPFVDNNYKNLAVVDLREGRIIGGGVVPHTRAITPDLHQICTGSSDWLDGFTDTMAGKVQVGYATPGGNVEMLAWDEGKFQPPRYNRE